MVKSASNRIILRSQVFPGTTIALATMVTVVLATDFMPWDLSAIVRLFAAVAVWPMQPTGPGAVTLFVEGSDLVANYILFERRIPIGTITGVELVPSAWPGPFFRRFPRLRIYVADGSWVIEAETYASRVETFVAALGAAARRCGIKSVGQLRRPRYLYAFDALSIFLGATLAAVYGSVNVYAFIGAVLFLLCWVIRSWNQLAKLASIAPVEAPTLRVWLDELSSDA